MCAGAPVSEFPCSGADEHSQGEATPTVRRARAEDVPAIVDLLVEDPISARREHTDHDLEPYRRAFAAVDADPAHELVCAVDTAGEVVGTLQLTVLPGLARRGVARGQIEAVHVAARCRGRGLGGALIEWAVAEAQRRGCGLVQLTSDAKRTDAHRFYERLGFEASHVGFKRTV